MMVTSHVVVGVATWSLVAHANGWPVNPMSTTLAVAGALAPDLDHPKSWLGRRLAIISVPVSKLFGHRGITHSLLAVLACLLVLRWNQWGWAVAPVCIGYLSHLVADSFTRAGVPFLWPWRRTFGLKLVRTGSFFEQVLVAGVVALAARPLLPASLQQMIPVIPKTILQIPNMPQLANMSHLPKYLLPY